MRRRTKLVLAITATVTVLVTVFSYIYISQLLRQRIIQANETASLLTTQLAYLASNAVPDLTSTTVDTSDPEAVRKAIAYYLGTDRDLNVMLQSVVGNWPIIYDAAIVDADGNAILHTNPGLTRKPIVKRPRFQTVQDTRFTAQLRLVYESPAVYDVGRPLKLNGVPFGSVRVGVSTVFLENEITPVLQRSLIYAITAILLSLILAAGISHLALGPLERLSRSLDSVSAGTADVIVDPNPSSDEYGLVTLKVAHLGRQMRDSKEIFSALKDNVDQIMANLLDGLMLFTRDSRVVLVSASVERFLGRPRHELLGRTVKEIFSTETQVGALVLEAFNLHRSISQGEIRSDKGRPMQVSLDFIQEKGTPIGALLTMRDMESVRRIENELETSRRLSASGRLTRGVAHEVKNPINAIVLHLQVLQNKLLEIDPDTQRHMDIIDSEIHRLDRVVQILVEFTRPRELHLDEIDLRRIVEDVAQLAGPDAAQHGVLITRELPPNTVLVRIDADLMKQALLNVVLNGVQAMPSGGNLTISTRQVEDEVITEVRDEGAGIPTELQEKIFELYFTTKKEGSGIGLANTYQILQWHYGSVDFESTEGRGTVFRLRLPVISAHRELEKAAKEAAARS